ncbi:MAG: hypothetical protein U0359_37785 [Byssovorax sp.]
MNDLRERVARLARSLEGLTADPEDAAGYARFLDLIAPGERRSDAETMARQSTCGLVVAGIWRAVLATVPAPLRPPYQSGAALRNIVATAGIAGALRDGRHRPQVGDVVHLQGVAGAVEHVYTAVEVGDDCAVVSIDGGQRDDRGLQTIASRTRVVHLGKDRLTDGAERPIIHVIDLDALGARFGIKPSEDDAGDGG